jgi:hypothetical protein
LHQEDSALRRTFFHRTDHLAARLGLNVQELPAIIGISRRTLFECRSADSAVSNKTWSKLAAAERDAGISNEPAESSTSPKEVGVVKATHAGQVEMPMGDDQFPELGKMIDVLRRIAAALEELVDQRRKEKE